jgi:hypothetical protein
MMWSRYNRLRIPSFQWKLSTQNINFLLAQYLHAKAYYHRMRWAHQSHTDNTLDINSTLWDDINRSGKICSSNKLISPNWWETIKVGGTRKLLLSVKCQQNFAQWMGGSCLLPGREIMSLDKIFTTKGFMRINDRSEGLNLWLGIFGSKSLATELKCKNIRRRNQAKSFKSSIYTYFPKPNDSFRKFDSRKTSPKSNSNYVRLKKW